MARVVNLSDERAKARKEEIDRLLEYAREILESDSGTFSEALKNNILVWKKAVDMDRQVRRLESRAGLLKVARPIKEKQ